MFTSKNNNGRNFGRDLDAEQLRRVCGGSTRPVDLVILKDFGANRKAGDGPTAPLDPNGISPWEVA